MTDKNTNQKTKKSKKGIFLRLSRYVLKEWPLFIPAVLLTLGSNQLSLMGPRYSGAAIDAVAAEGGVDFPTVWRSIGFMLGCYIISAILSYVLSVIVIKMSQRIFRQRSIQKKAFFFLSNFINISSNKKH